MPTVQELLTDIDLMLPNTFTTVQKLVWMNEAQRLLFKHMNNNNIAEFSTVEGLAAYTLPDNCDMDQIISVEVANEDPVTTNTQFTAYAFTPLTGEFTGNNYYDATSGLIGLYPVPDGIYSVKVFYKERPFILSESNLTLIPDLNEDYHPALKSYVLSKIAKAGNSPDVELSNNYTSDFNNYIDMMFKDRMESKVKTPTKSKHNRWW